MIWSVRSALLEQSVYDERLGRVVNNLAEYHVPVNADVGITAAAVANAVFHASGKRVRDLPITVDKLL